MTEERAVNFRPGAGIILFFQQNQYARELALGFCLFIVCLIGIISRPENQLAAIWPANSFLLGMLLRQPSLGTMRGWACGIGGYLLADAVMGSGLWDNIALNSCNVASVAVAYYLLGRDPHEQIDYSAPTTFLLLLAAMLAGSLTAGVMGAMIETPGSSHEWAEQFAFWASSQLVNFIALLPLMIHFPTWPQLKSASEAALRKWRLSAWLPAVAFIISLLASMQVHGLMALAIPVPALLWCALVYHRFIVSLLSFIFIMWNLLAMGSGLIDYSGDVSSRTDVMSTRLGVALVALAPLFVSTALAMQKDMSVRLRKMAERDTLTGVLNRRTFWDKAEQKFRTHGGGDIVLGLIAPENVRLVNSEFGHRRGDALLIRVGEIVQQRLGKGALVGRVSGDRFGICTALLSDAEMQQIAQEICDTIRAESLTMADGTQLEISASIGLRRTAFGESFQVAWSETEMVLQQFRQQSRDGVAFAEARSDGAGLKT